MTRAVRQDVVIGFAPLVRPNPARRIRPDTIVSVTGEAVDEVMSSRVWLPAAEVT